MKLCLRKPRKVSIEIFSQVSWISYPVVAEERAEVRGFLLVDELDKAGAVHGVDGGEDAAREQAQLQELRYGLVLCGFCHEIFRVAWDRRARWTRDFM